MKMFGHLSLVGGLFIAAGIATGQPVNDDCTGAIDISGVTLPYVTTPTDISLCFAAAEGAMCTRTGYTIWYKMRATADANLTFTTCPDDAPGNTMTDTVIGVYTSADGNCDLIELLDCNDDTCDHTSAVSVAVTAGQLYYIQVGQWEIDPPFPGEETIQLAVKVTSPPPPDRMYEVGDAGELIGTAQIANTGTGSLGSIEGQLDLDAADMYLIEICDPAAFSATTRGGTGMDTQLYLFDSTGHGVVFDDDADADTFQSTITGQFVPAPGQYLIAVAAYDADPLDSLGNALWNDRPFVGERAADGPGRANALTQWDNQSQYEGTYTIFLTGAAYIGGCGTGGCPECAADFNQDGGVDGGDVEAFYIAWGNGETCGDVNLDGGVDGADVESFFVVWEAGGC